MNDVLMVVCGGGSYRAISNAKDILDIPMHVISNIESTLSFEDPESIREAMKGYRTIVPFCILGGDFGNDQIRRVIQCARDAECKVVSIVGIPFMMEPERRERALQLEPEVEFLSDRTLIFDMNTVLMNFIDRRIDYFMRMVDRYIVFSINGIAESISGPFFSTFPSGKYTFGCYSDVIPNNAVKKAMGAMMYETGTIGSCIVMVSSRITSAEMEDIRNTMASEYNLVPDVIRRSDSDDSKVLVFVDVHSA